MFIDVNEIAPEGLQIDRALTLPPILPAGGEPAPLSAVRLIGSFSKFKGDFDFRGRVEAVVFLTCSRCLARFEFPVQGDCHRIYRVGKLGQVRSEGELTDDELALTPFEGERIDLGELVREQLYLLLPLKPLCRPQCRGICSGCGKNRNQEECSCPEEERGAGPLTMKIPLK